MTDVVSDLDTFLTFRNKVNQIISEVGSLPSLSTTNKTSIVNAINELNVNTARYVLKSNPSGADSALTQDLLTNYTFSGNTTFSGSGTLQISNTLRIGSTGSDIDLRNAFIKLGNPSSGSPFGNAGLIVQRSSSLQNAKLYWNETTDKWVLDNNSQTNQELYHFGNVNSLAKNYLDNGVLSSENLNLSSTFPYLEFNNTDGSTDSKRWRIRPSSSNNDLVMTYLADNGSAENPFLVFQRSGNNVISFDFLSSSNSLLEIEVSQTNVKNILKVNTINEYTSNNGVFIEGIKVKDNFFSYNSQNNISFETSGIIFNTLSTNLDFSVNDDFGLAFFIDASMAKIYSKKEHIFENNLKVNTINEYTSNNGVLIDGCLLKNTTITVNDIYSINNLYINLDNDNANSNSFFGIKNSSSELKFLVYEDGGTYIKRTSGHGLSIVHENIGLTDIEAIPFLDFRYSNSIGGTSTRLGHIGYGSSTNKDLDIFNSIGNVNYIVPSNYYHDFQGLTKFDLSVSVNTINEYTSNNGVLIDGCLLKDSSFISSSIKSYGNIIVDLDIDNTTSNAYFSLRDNGTKEILRIGDEGDFILKSTSTGGLLTLVKESSNVNALLFMDFNYATTVGGTLVRMGYMGYGSASNQHLYIQNDNPSGDVIYNVASGNYHIFNRGAYIPSIATNSITEYSSGGGVEIDGCLIKDGKASQVLGETLSWSPTLRDGDGSSIPYTNGSYSAYRVGNLVYCRFRAEVIGSGGSNDHPYVNLPIAEESYQMLGNCWGSYNTLPNGGEDAPTDQGNMVAIGGNAFFKTSGYGTLNGTFVDDYIHFSFCYKV